MFAMFPLFVGRLTGAATAWEGDVEGSVAFNFENNLFEKISQIFSERLFLTKNATLSMMSNALFLGSRSGAGKL